MIIHKTPLAGAGLIVFAVLMTGVATSASAEAFYLKEQSVKGAGRAWSGMAAERGVQGLWWNPAAIARSERQVYLGAHALFLDSGVDDTGSTLTRPVVPGGLTTPVGGEFRAIDPIQNGVVPNFALSTPIGDRLAVGFSMAAPFNFTTEYNDRSFTRYDALKSELLSVNAGLVVAYQVTDWLDVGAGLDIQYADAELTSALPNLSPLLPDGQNALKGDGIDYGWNVGAQVHRGPLSLGLSYRSKIEHELEGDVVISGLVGPLASANVDTDGVATFTTPWMASAAIRYDLTDRWTLNAQVNRMGWSEFDAIRVAYGSTGNVINQNYRDVTTGAVGVDYKATDTVTLRAGVGYDPTPTRDGERTARIPDSDRFLYSVGGSVDVKPGVTVDAAVTYIALDDGEISDDRTLYAGTAAATQSSLRGDVEGQGLGLSLGATWSF